MADPIRVLLAEDDPVNTMVVTAMLEKLGCRVHATTDGRQAADHGAVGIDLCILDARMPVLDGFGAARALRAQPAGDRLPIVGLTGDESEETRALALSSGMDEVLIKPVTLEALKGVLERCLTG